MFKHTLNFTTFIKVNRKKSRAEASFFIESFDNFESFVKVFFSDFLESMWRTSTENLSQVKMTWLKEKKYESEANLPSQSSCPTKYLISSFRLSLIFKGSEDQNPGHKVANYAWRNW